MGSRRERFYLNQETFRSANKGMSEAVSVDGSTLIPFLCECPDFDCLGRLEATITEFEAAHARGDQYFILPGHLRAEGEEILSENDRYEVVSKA
jgi:hypothetical protein